ncbi:MAG: hypothetical protein IJ560_02515 [Alphaproteobacteria bacterium]|nr:hypothetical protein [Alphaproteobacteria bacterium]
MADFWGFIKNNLRTKKRWFFGAWGVVCGIGAANAELPENVKFCIPKQYTVTYDCPAGGNAPTQQSTAYGNNFTTGVGCNNAPAWRVDDSDTIITSNTTIPYAYTHDIVLHADYSPWYTIAGGKLINADPDVYLEVGKLGAYINTEFVATMSSAYECMFAFTRFTNDANDFGIGNPFGARNENSPYQSFGIYAGSNYKTGFSRGNSNITPLSFTFGQMYKFYESATDQIIDDISYTWNAQMDPSRYSLYMFGYNVANNVQAAYVRSPYCKIWDDNILVRHFIPVPRGLRIGDFTVPSNGIWDIVGQRFFGNSGTGEFIYGRDSGE